MKERHTKYVLRKDGRIQMTRTIDGKRVSFYGKSDKECEQKYAAYLRFPEQKPKVKCRNFQKCAEDWWELKEPELSPNSVRNYKAIYQIVAAEFNKTPVTEITPVLIANYLRKTAAQGYSQKAINNRKSVIKSILDNALLAGEIPSNPCINLPFIKGKAKVPRRIASDADLRLIEAHRSDSNIARMIYFILWTGCRRGEAAALQWKHIDRENGTAHICQTLAYSSPTPQIKPCPKTNAGVRDIVIPQRVLDILPQGINPPNKYVFFPDGLPKEKKFQTLIDDYRREIGLSCTLHQLRHSYATMLHSAGVDAKDAQYLLGHSSILVTQDIYTELDKNTRIRAAKQIEKYMTGDSTVVKSVVSDSE